MLWVAITIFAALSQTIRTALQKSLKAKLDDTSVNWVRYAYGLPFVLLALFFVLSWNAQGLPPVAPLFWLYASLTAFFQVIATAFLIKLFGTRNFVIGSAFARFEAVLSAIFALLFFSETLNAMGIIAIIVGSVGVIILSITKGFKFDFQNAIIGLGAGAGFALAAVFARASTQAVDASFIIAALTALTFVLILQVIGLGIWIGIRKPQAFRAIASQSRAATLVGFTSALGSTGWFSAFALTSAAYVKTLGQIEMVFAILISLLIFKEKISIPEIIGMALIVLSVVLVINF